MRASVAAWAVAALGLCAFAAGEAAASRPVPRSRFGGTPGQVRHPTTRGRIAPEGTVPNLRRSSHRRLHGGPGLTAPPSAFEIGAERDGVRAAVTGVYNVMDYGATSECDFVMGNGSSFTDNTAAFNKALAAAGAAGGGTVYAPPGCYVFGGALVVPSAVALQGSYETVPSHDMAVHPPQAPTDGSVLVPCGFRGNASGPAFVTLPLDAGLAGFTIVYARQERVNTPVPYPWTISMTGANSFVTDVELLGAWQGINAVAAHRHYIARVQGQPILTGIRVDSTYDIGRIEDVHWNPWFSTAQPFMSYQLIHGTAFVFGRSDWEYVFNTFAFGYAVGYHFIQTPTGEMNANLLGLGADLAINASVLVDASQAPGLLFTNGEFTAFHTKGWLPGSTEPSTQVVVSGTNTGPVKFVDSSFWGPDAQVANVAGSGTTSFSSCEFVQWDLIDKTPRPAITANSGSLILQGNDFAYNGSQLALNKGVKKAVVTGNIFVGTKRFAVDPSVNYQEAANAFDASDDAQ